MAAQRVRSLLMRSDVPVAAVLVASSIAGDPSLVSGMGGLVATHFGNMGSTPDRLQSLSRPGGGCTSRAEWTTNSAVRGEWNDARFKDHFHVSRTTHKSVVAGRAQ